MRDAIIAFLNALNIKPFVVSDELPWDKDGEPLYRKNFRRIYVDRPQTSQDSLIETLNGPSIVNNTTQVSVYVCVDAKNLPTNYETLVNAIKGARVTTGISGVTQRTVQVTENLDGDMIDTEFVFSFTDVKILT